MKIEILDQKYNPLLKRKEVVFEVDHSQEGQTTPRIEVRKNLASALKTNFDLVFIERFETKTGTMIAKGEANTYETLEQAKLVELQHITLRNSPPQKPADQEKRSQIEPEEKQSAEEKHKEEAKTQEKTEKATLKEMEKSEKLAPESDEKEG